MSRAQERGTQRPVEALEQQAVNTQEIAVALQAIQKRRPDPDDRRALLMWVDEVAALVKRKPFDFPARDFVRLTQNLDRQKVVDVLAGQIEMMQMVLNYFLPLAIQKVKHLASIDHIPETQRKAIRDLDSALMTEFPVKTVRWREVAQRLDVKEGRVRTAIEGLRKGNTQRKLSVAPKGARKLKG